MITEINEAIISCKKKKKADENPDSWEDVGYFKNWKFPEFESKLFEIERNQMFTGSGE